MFFSGKLHAQISELEQELHSLQRDNQRLIDDNGSLTRRVVEMEQQLADSADQTDLSSVWVQGGRLVSDVREAIAHAAANMANEKERMAESFGIFDETETAVSHILDHVAEIQQRSESGNANVQNLLGVSQNIEKFVGVIRDISDQTNLLALNAAIEAARAGDSGRGFAVVADEVRNLARKASEASNEINNLVGQIMSQTQVASEDIGQVQNLSSEVVASAEQIRNAVHQVVDLSKSMSDVITRSAMDTFIETVKMDHVAWKNSVYEAIVRQDFSLLDSLADHHSCRLGGWYYRGEGRDRYSDDAAFRSLEQPHRQVHESGAEALRAARKGDLPAAAASLSDMEQASGEVARHLDRLRSE